MCKLMADLSDTAQVFRVMQALNSGTSERNYKRLLGTPEGERVAASCVEMIEILSNFKCLYSLKPGTVGAAYRAFLDRTGFSAEGLAKVSNQLGRAYDVETPYAWFSRRERDVHEIQHVLTGYCANDPLGELCLAAYTFAQNRGLGWAFIAVIGALKSLTEAHRWDVVRAVWEGYRHGNKASWIHKEDIATLFAEPIEAARDRLNIARPVVYECTQQKVPAAKSSWLMATD
jgi:ubiquinone biosynthesis protein COQ4